MKIFKYFTLVALVAATFVGCKKAEVADDKKGPDATGDITLTVVSNTIDVNTPIEFIVTDSESGDDLTSSSTIYNKSDFSAVENPFTPTLDGTYKFYATCGDSISNDVEVVVNAVKPELPQDPDSANTSFKHRILLVDHTGNTCSFCPKMMAALKEVSETEDYHSKFHEAMAHSYAQTDPATSSTAYSISGFFGVTAYPTLTYNFDKSVVSSTNTEVIKQNIDALWKSEAEAGIAAAANLASQSVLVKAEIKAAVAGEYRINAWLLEDNILAEQAGASSSQSWMNTHNNAIRYAPITDPITGYDLGSIEAGHTAEKEMTLKIEKSKWNRDNFKVMVIASKKGSNGNYDVANVAICPINSTVAYDYNN